MDITEIRQNIAVNISVMRNAAGLTQAQFAEKLNYTDKAISKWERGESVPDIAVLWKIADMFGVTTDWLYGYTETVVSATGAPPTDLDTEELLLITVYRSASPDRRNRAIRVLTGQE